MKKPDALRAALVALMPDLARDPDRLAMWVEKGHIRCRAGTHGFAWEYDLTVLFKDFAGDPAVPFFVVTEWARSAQPELFTPGAKNGFAFEVDILDDKTFDIQMVLPLDECIAAISAGSGAWQLSAVDQSAQIGIDDAPLGAGGGPLRSIWHNGQQIAPTTEPQS